MINSLLIANRGEIARRIIRTARRLGIRTVAVYSEVDADTPHTREADEAVAIGAAPALESYLSPEKILAAARATRVEAIHPGYGFLSENAEFAEAVIAAGFVWVGPPPKAMRTMGLKNAAKALAASAGVPVTPGYSGTDQTTKRLAEEAEKLRFPVLIKAVAGGGGKGLRKVDRASEFADALASARREAKAAFGDDRVLLETYIGHSRHIEVQIFGDRHGNLVHLFERDCSLQRRHQKVIEEAPAPGLSEAFRDALCDAAVRVAKAVSYEGAGTVEFIADASKGLDPGRVWFMEMNTRLQVEHPVTEMITGLDLVEWQLLVASGSPLPLRQDEITRQGHAIEARLYAEDPVSSLPSTGPLLHLRLPSHLRVETGVEEGDAVTPFYDPMIAKLISYASTRQDAAAKLATACRGVEVWPVKTNAHLMTRLLSASAFQTGAVETSLLGTMMPEVEIPGRVLIAAARARIEGVRAKALDPASPWVALAGFRLNAAPAIEVKLRSGRETHFVRLDPSTTDPELYVIHHGETLVVFAEGQAYEFAEPNHEGAGGAGEANGVLRSPMPGRVVTVAAKLGAAVASGDPILVVEAMKMEHTLRAPFDGVLTELKAEPGQQVSEGDALATLEPKAR